MKGSPSQRPVSFGPSRGNRSSGSREGRRPGRRIIACDQAVAGPRTPRDTRHCVVAGGAASSPAINLWLGAALTVEDTSVVLPRVLVATEHQLGREALAGLLDARADLDVVAATGSGTEAIERITMLAPDVAIIDQRLQDVDGLWVATEIRRRGGQTGMLCLTSDVDAASVHRLMAAGMTGSVHEADSIDELVTAIHAVAEGRRYVSWSNAADDRAAGGRGRCPVPLMQLLDAVTYHDLLDVVARLEVTRLAAHAYTSDELVREVRRRQWEAAARLALFARLTSRECDILAGLSAGKSAEQLAAEHVVSLATERSHIRGVLEKLDVNSQVAAVALAWRLGWPQRDRGRSRQRLP